MSHHNTVGSLAKSAPISDAEAADLGVSSVRQGFVKNHSTGKTVQYKLGIKHYANIPAKPTEQAG